MFSVFHYCIMSSNYLKNCKLYNTRCDFVILSCTYYREFDNRHEGRTGAVVSVAGRVYGEADI